LQRLTGKALRESPDEGAVRIDMDADSRQIPGLQVVDILLQAVQRRLPGYVAKGASHFAQNEIRTSSAAGYRR
jgi:hypothetical protein